MVELKDVIERLLQQASLAPEKKMTGAFVGTGNNVLGSGMRMAAKVDYYDRLIREMDLVGWDRLVHIDNAMSSLELCLRDAADRPHSLLVGLPLDYPESAPTCSANLPIELTLRWNSGCCLGDAVDQVERQLELYQDFWDVMDDWDTNTWVLEPDYPSRSATFRRIAIGSHCSLHVSIKPLRPRAVCECRFLGSDARVNPIRQQLNARLHLWDRKLTPRHNLETILDLEFPSPRTSEKKDFSLECGICYAYKLEGAFPDRVCENARCGRPFHRACLYEWLKSLPSSRQSFNTVFGVCPYCSTAITSTNR